MTRRRFFLAALGLFVSCNLANAQTAGVLYTWNGTGNIQDWGNGNVSGVTGGPNGTSIANSTPGQLTITELGDQLDTSVKGEAFVIQDGYNRRTEASTQLGGLDLTGLDYIEIDVSHTGTANVNVQMFIQTTPNYNYLWYGPGPTYTFQGPDWSVPPNVVTTLRFPVNMVTPAQQAWINSIGLSVRDHTDQNANLTWNISEVRSVGAGLTVRNVGTFNAGTSDNGLNGSYVNFGGNAIVGHTPNNADPNGPPGNHDGSTVQDQTGLSQVTDGNGVGSLQWTDKGNGGVTTNPSGAAISWVNGTAYTNNNSFYERLADFSNYNRLTIRLKATDVTPGGGGTIGGQAFFQTGAYINTVVPGSPALSIPVDGQYHDFIFSLAAVPNLQDVQDFGLQLFGHANDVMINVDNVQFSKVAGVPGDYNGNGVVDMADYVLWRNGGPLQNEVNSIGTVDASDYDAWRARFGNTSGSGSLNGAAVPEPTGLALMFAAVVGGLITGRRRC